MTEAEAARATASEALVQARRQGAEAGAARARIAAEVAALTEVLEARGTASAQPILDQVRVPPGLEAALGAALGEALESPADAAAARHWRNLPPLMVAQPLPDGAVPLSRLVEAPAALARALSQVGLLARGMDGAALQAGLRPGQALVTEEGAVWRWDGHTHHAGAPTPGAVRLAQRNALRAAEARLDQAEVTAAETEAARSAAEAAEAEAANAEAAARNARSAAEAAASAARRAEGELAARDARAESRIAALEPQLARLAEDRAEADAARAFVLASQRTIGQPINVVGDGDEENFNFTYTVTNGTDSDVGFVNATSVPCFVAGTLIATTDGDRRVEGLLPGDLVMTKDEGPQPLRWIGSRRVTATGDFAPIHIRANTLGQHRDLLVSPLHRVLIKDNLAELLFGEAEVLVAARDLVNDYSITRRTGGEVTYVHLLFDRHQVVFSEGLETESFLPGPQTSSSFEADMVAEIYSIFPDLDPDAGTGYPVAARRTLKRYEAELLRSVKVA